MKYFLPGDSSLLYNPTQNALTIYMGGTTTTGFPAFHRPVYDRGCSFPCPDGPPNPRLFFHWRKHYWVQSSRFVAPNTRPKRPTVGSFVAAILSRLTPTSVLTDTLSSRSLDWFSRNQSCLANGELLLTASPYHGSAALSSNVR
jgi:hypothetical protein